MSESWLLDECIIFMVCGSENMIALLWMPFGLSGDVSEYTHVREDHKFLSHLL